MNEAPRTPAILTRRRSALSVAIAIAVVGILPAALFPGGGGTHIPVGAYFVGDMESPLGTNFQLISERGAALPERVTSPVRLGSHAVRMTVAPGQERSELQGNQGKITLKLWPGTTAWFADSVDLAPGFPTAVPPSINGWQTIIQWKQGGGTESTSPPIEVAVRDRAFILAGGFGCPYHPERFALNLAPARVNAWTDFMFRIYFSTAGKGWITAYVNDRLIVERYRPRCGTAYPEPYARFQMIRFGYYRDPAIRIPGTVFHDEYRMGPTEASVSLYG